MSKFVVCALYKFTRLEDYVDLREPLYKVMDENEVRGTLLLASEGINGTISGSRQGIDTVLEWLHSNERLNPIEYFDAEKEVISYKWGKETSGKFGIRKNYLEKAFLYIYCA